MATHPHNHPPHSHLHDNPPLTLTIKITNTTPHQRNTYRTHRKLGFTRPQTNLIIYGMQLQQHTDI